MHRYYRVLPTEKTVPGVWKAAIFLPWTTPAVNEHIPSRWRNCYSSSQYWYKRNT